MTFIWNYLSIKPDLTLTRWFLIRFPVNFFIFPAGNTRAPAGKITPCYPHTTQRRWLFKIVRKNLIFKHPFSWPKCLQNRLVSPSATKLSINPTLIKIHPTFQPYSTYHAPSLNNATLDFPGTLKPTIYSEHINRPDLF